MPSTTTPCCMGGHRTSLFALCAALGLACSGGSTATPAPPALPAIGTAGGTVTEPSGASVVVPPGALGADVTIRIAKDSTGAPPLPEGLVAAGSTYVVTPHGGDFAEPVMVRIPAPAVTLQPNQELKLAKADPGGTWVVQDSVLDGAYLASKVLSFSYFMPVRVNRLLSLELLPSFAATTTVTCNGQPCTSSLVGTQTLVFTVTGNGGQIPQGCTRPGIQLSELSRSWSSSQALTGEGPYQFVVTRDPPPEPYSARYWETELTCDSLRRQVLELKVLAWAPSYVTDVRYTTVATCNGQPCAPLLEGAQNVEIAFTGNGGLLPWRCSRGTFDIRMSAPATDQRVGSAEWLNGLQTFGASLKIRPFSSPSGEGYLEVNWTPTVTGRRVEILGRIDCPEIPIAIRAPGVTLEWILPSPYTPVFVIQPRSMLVVAGETASLSAALFAIGPTAVLQWQSRAPGNPSAWGDVGAGTGGTTLHYTTPVLGLAASGTEYRLRARNGHGTAYTQPATVAVSDVPVAPVITTQPAGLTVVSGSEAVFAVAARGTEALSYQWYRDGVEIPGANAPVHTWPATTADGGARLSVRVSNAVGQAASQEAILTVIAGGAALVAPTIVTQPVSVLVNAGNTATFAAGVSGSPPLAYQWRRNGADLPGGTDAFYSIASAMVGDAGTYAVVVSNGIGSDTSYNVQLTVNPTPLLVVPVITTQPATQVLQPGGSATFAVAASGTGPLTYQWLLDGAPIDGATEAVLLLGDVGLLDAGSYTVTVGNLMGGVTSGPAQLILVGAPLIVGHPSAATAVEGTTATFTVAATGAALRYQWQRDGVGIAGATAASYTTPVLTVGDHGATFTVLVYNGSGLVLSKAARLTVNGLTPPGMALFVGNFVLGGGGGAADATGLDARLDTPDGLVADSVGNLYVAEANIPLVAKVTPDGVVTTLFQHTNSVTSLAIGPDGSLYVGAACGMPRLMPPLAAGAVNQPVQTGSCVVGQVRGITVDQAGAVLVSLPAGNAIYGFGVSGGVAGYAVFAGAPDVYLSPGTSDGSGTAARFNAQQGMVRAADGTLYVADTGNHTIRTVTPAGDVTTWIGAPGIPGTVDGNGAAARLHRPTQLAFDAAGNLFVLTQGDPAAPVAQVRRITPAGDVTTLFDATAEVLAIATAAEAPWAQNIRGLAVLGTNRVALTAGNAIVLRTLR